MEEDRKETRTDAAPATGAAGTAAAAGTGGTPEKTLTQAEAEQLAEKRLARARRDREKELAEARAAGVREGEARARMSEAERLRADREQAERDAGAREAALRAREAEITRRELRAEAAGTLAERGLPRELGELLDYADADALAGSIDALERAFRAAVQSGVDARLRAGGVRLKAAGPARNAEEMDDATYYASLCRSKSADFERRGNAPT